MLTGCASTPHNPQTIPTKSATELAVEQIPDDMLTYCEGMPPAPDNSLGSLLSDGTTAMFLLAGCRGRNKALVDYLRPVVEKERAKKAGHR